MPLCPISRIRPMGCSASFKKANFLYTFSGKLPRLDFPWNPLLSVALTSDEYA